MGFKKINSQYEIEKRIKDDEELKECLKNEIIDYKNNKSNYKKFDKVDDLIKNLEGFMSNEDLQNIIIDNLTKINNKFDKLDIKLYEINSKLDKFDAILSHVFVQKRAEEITTDDDKNNKIAELTKEMEDLQKQADSFMSKKVKLREQLNLLLKE